MTTKILIANRGEIARRILKAAKEKSLIVGVIATPEDKNSLVCQEADQVLIVDSYLNGAQIVQQAKSFGAQLLHPGYGFLSENSAFAQLCEENHINFIGPTSAQIKQLGSKESSKHIAQKCNVPTLASLSSHDLKNIPQSNWKDEFEVKSIYPPYLIKASGGGGGRGMRIVHNFSEIPEQLKRAADEALQAFNDDTVFVERYLSHPRHIEIQVFGDGKGSGVYLGERECSLQRRHQKVIEEAPSVVITPELRAKMGQASLALVKQSKYRGAGTVEFLFDENHNFFFLEMNTRLQVEHPVTELVYNVDLVHAQIDLALGKWPFENRVDLQNPAPTGVALEARILAEDPRQNFMPTPGVIEFYQEPIGEGIRVDSGVTTGSVILPHFDSMIAKLIVFAPTREQAVIKLQNALKNFVIFGITTNIPFLISLTKRKEFLEGKESTHFIEENLHDLNLPLVCENDLKNLLSFASREKLFNHYQVQSNHFDVVDIFSRQKNLNSISLLNTINFKNFTYPSYLNAKQELEINIDGERIVLENPGYYNQIFASSDQSSHEIKAPMAGKVYDIKAQKGDKVNKGDVLFILESMKMQIEVRASISGYLTNICVEKNQILTGKNTLGILQLHSSDN